VSALKPGESATFAKTVSEADVGLYLGLSGDRLPVYLEADLAASPGAGGRQLAPSPIAVGHISTAMALVSSRLPPPGAVSYRYSLEFPDLLYVGDTLTTRVTVKTIDDARREIVLDVVCRTDDGRVVARGCSYLRLLRPTANESSSQREHS
jgi:3-hydroxybutyryl-CoA dehydratase